MASSARGESSGGKFRKPSTAQRSQKTPYERPPPTSVRSSGVDSSEESGGGWLSKVVGSAQSLLTYGVRKLFGSAFRRSLVSDVTEKSRVGRVESTPGLSVKDGFADLENILKKRTYTRSEANRLTAFLRSKAAVSSTSIDERIATPAYLAKAYMGSRPSGIRGLPVRDDSIFLKRTRFPSKSPAPKLSGERTMEDGFVAPRTPRRSDIYKMARSPNFKAQSTAKSLKRRSSVLDGEIVSVGPVRRVRQKASRSLASPSSENLSSGSTHGSQSGPKRGNSIFYNDIGSVGPVKRIRQKASFPSRWLALPVPESPPSVRSSGPLNIVQKSKVSSAEDVPASGFNLVPPASTEAALKILHQLDGMESAKERSPSKLSSSMLRGQALKSLQTVDAPKVLDNIPENKANSSVSSHQKQDKTGGSGSREFVSLSEKKKANSLVSTHRKQEKSGSSESLALSEKTNSAADDTKKAGSSKDQKIRVKDVYLRLTSSLEERPPKKSAFRMISDEEWEDYLVAEPTPFEEAEVHNVLKVENGVSFSGTKGKELVTSSEAMASTSYTPNGDASQSTSNGSPETGRSQFSTLPVESVEQSDMPSEPTSKVIQENEKSSISPANLASGEECISREEPKKAAPVFPNTFSSPAATEFTNENNGTSAAIKLDKPSSSAFGVSAAFGKPTETKKNDGNSASGAESTTAAESVLNGSLGEPAAAPLSASSVSESSGQVPKEAEVKNQTFGNSGMASADTSTENAFAAKTSEFKSTSGFSFWNSPAVADAGKITFGGTSSAACGSTLNPSSAPGSSPSLGFGVSSFSSSNPGRESSKYPGGFGAFNGSNSFGASSPAFTSSGSTSAAFKPSSVPKGEEELFTSSEAMTSTSYTPNSDASQSTFNESTETGRSQFATLPMESVKQSDMPSEPTSNEFPNTWSPAATEFSYGNNGTSAAGNLEKPTALLLEYLRLLETQMKQIRMSCNSASGAESTTSVESTLTIVLLVQIYSHIPSNNYEKHPRFCVWELPCLWQTLVKLALVGHPLRLVAAH